MPDHHLPRSAFARRRRHRWAPPLAVLAGGLFGSGVRAAFTFSFPVASASFPWTTLVVNLAGSLFLGLYLARSQSSVLARWSLQFWAIGALGSFTTFSTFSFEVFSMVDTGTWTMAASYVLASTVGGLAAAVLGQRAGRLKR